MTLSLPAPWSATKPRYEAAAFHLCLIGVVIAAQVIVAPSRYLAADNTWHFQFARDVVAGVPVYWSAVDANRLFPDLLFSMIACLLPNGTSFATWTVYFYGLVAVACYLGIDALSRMLFESDRDKRVGTVFMVFGLLLFMLFVPFWDVWLIEPGNHGAGLPVCFVSLALLLHIRQTEWAPAGVAALFIALASAVAASNRYLIVAFLLPLIAAAALAYPCELLGRNPAAAVGAERRGGSWRKHRYLLVAVIVAITAAYGYIGWAWLGSLSWHKVVQLGGMPELPKSDYLDWAGQRLDRVATELGASTRELWTAPIGGAWGAPIGVGVLLATVPAAALAFARRIARRRQLSNGEENRFFFALFAGASAAATLGFVTFLTEGSGSWQFRFLAVSVAFAVVFFCSLLVLPSARLPRAYTGPWVAAAVLGVALLALSGLVSASRKGPIAAEEAGFASAIAELETRLRTHSSALPMRGLSEYWIANDVTSRSNILQIETMEPEKGQFRFYNDNAEHLCHNEFFFVLQDAAKDEPRMAALVDALGKPTSTESIDLARFPKVKILYYDPKILADRIIQEARRTAVRLFPTFGCAR